jgi:cyclophilin family peptidyl-prolyl cis-trans isomerase
MDRRRQLKHLQHPPEGPKPDIYEEIHGMAYTPLEGNKDDHKIRDENPVVFLDISSRGGKRNSRGLLSKPRLIGRIHIELRLDICPMTCSNFIELLKGSRGTSIYDGIDYTYKNTKIHRIVKDRMFQGGDLLGQDGECSRSIFNQGSLFVDETFVLRHTGPGCLSMCNRGPNTNGSIFQITFTAQETLDEKNVVFGCVCSDEGFATLEVINTFATDGGAPSEELYISDTGQTYPNN